MPDGWKVQIVASNDQPVIEMQCSAAVAWADGDPSDLEQHADSAVMAMADRMVDDLMALRTKLAAKYVDYSIECAHEVGTAQPNTDLFECKKCGVTVASGDLS